MMSRFGEWGFKMIKRSLWVLFGLLAGLIMISGTGWAQTTPYPAPPITVSSSIVPTSSTVSTPQLTTSDALPNTGAGFNIGATLAMGGGILAAGVALVVLGSRRVRRH